MLPLYEIKYSTRRTISIRISRTGDLIVSAPIGLPENKVHTFVISKQQRILKKIEEIKKRIPDIETNITKQMKEHALIQILPRVDYYADLMGLSHKITDIKITTAQTKRGSCSSRGGLMFHRKLSQFPISIVDYVVVHELAHLVHFNHSKYFRNLVEQYHPDYKISKTRLKNNGNGLGIG